jgi:hypothetical protein
MPKTSRDTKKDCGKPGCQNDHRRKMLVRWDEMIEQAHFPVVGTFREVAGQVGDVGSSGQTGHPKEN